MFSKVARSPARLAGEFVFALSIVFAVLEGLIRLLWTPEGSMAPIAGYEAPLLRVALLFIGWDVALGVVLILAIRRRLHSEVFTVRPTSRPAVSLLVAGWNEVGCIAETVQRWASQQHVTFEIVVGDDGSTDGTSARLVTACGLHSVGPAEWEGLVVGVPVRLFRLPHHGKGATLNALARRAKHSVLVTTDADTTPAPDALAMLAEAFVDERVDSATGVVTIRNGRDGWLLANQSAEYLKNAWARIAWSSLGGLEQVPGAFAGIRAPVFFAAGGFPEDSLTEDYELSFRVIAANLGHKVPVVATVLRAQVFTDGPGTVRGFIRQRTRWFAGFLSTLFRFRALIANPKAGVFGVVRLPLKVFDAGLPLLAFASLIILVRGGLDSALSVSRVSIALFAVRWVWDLVVYGLAVRAARNLGDQTMSHEAAPTSAIGWVCTAMEALTYVWLKHVSALRGMVWAVSRVRDWEASREAPVAVVVPTPDRE